MIARARAIRRGEARAIDWIDEALAAARALAPCRLVVHLDEAALREEAAALDAAIAAGADPGPLCGCPVAIKDNLAVAGAPLGAASALLEGHVAVEDAAVVARLRAAGAIPFGRANMDEFGIGSATQASVYGPAAHPGDPRRIPGGSSGGSAGLVAAGVVPLALGSDSGGSTRQPAALCGVYGLKPTYGRLSRRGLIALASSTDCVGLFAAHPADLALLFGLLAGQDAGDPTSRPLPPPRAHREPIAGLRIGLPAADPQATPAAQAAVEAVAHALAAQGAQLCPQPALPHDLALDAYTVICAAEAHSNLARYDGLRFGLPAAPTDAALRALRAQFGAPVRQRLALGAALLREGRLYPQATAARAACSRLLDQQLAEVDALLLPTTPGPAPLRADWGPELAARADHFTALASITGHPALNLPAGRVDGLPIGVQCVSHRDAEPLLFDLAQALGAPP